MHVIHPLVPVSDEAAREAVEATKRGHARALADAALGLIAYPRDGDDNPDDGGSDEFHLICAIQHQFTINLSAIANGREANDEASNVRMALAMAISMLGHREDDPAVGARICLERVAELIGMDLHYAWYSTDAARLANLLLGYPESHLRY
jgi:hypothetical protein